MFAKLVSLTASRRPIQDNLLKYVSETSPARAEYLYLLRLSQSNRMTSRERGKRDIMTCGECLFTSFGVNFVKQLPFCLGLTSVSTTLSVLRCFRGKVPGDLASRSQFVTRSKVYGVSRAQALLWNFPVYLILHSTCRFEKALEDKFQ